MKTLCVSLLSAIAVFFINTTAFALIYKITTATNIIADGSVDAGEWNQADYQADAGCTGGAMYAQMSNGYQAGSENYTGIFKYLLHNIEQLQTNEDADYNAFDIYNADGTQVALTVWIFDNVDETNDAAWMAAAGLSSYGSSIVDTGFLVYNVALDEYRKYNLGDTRPEDGGYDWDYYWGVYGAGGFNNSAFTNGLPLSINNNNEVYELIYHDSATIVNTGPRRSIKDPDACSCNGLPICPLFIYIDDDITPDPTLVVLAGPLKATIIENNVLIEWKTDMEVDNAGFNIWRSETEAGEYVKINDSIIPAKGSGSQYNFTDDAVVKGKTYYYKLEDIDLNGASTFHGPVLAGSHNGLLPAIQLLLKD